MKVAFIFGKGIDGCGVTMGAAFYEKWLREQGHETVVINFNNDQTFGRAKLTKWIGDLLEVTKNDKKVPQNIIDRVNECDIAIFHSHPTRRRAAYVDRYREFIEKLDNPIKVMHDHGITKGATDFVTQGCEIFAMADVGVIMSKDGYAEGAYTTFDPNLKGRMIENPIWIDTAKYDRFRLPFEERQKHFLYLGRFAGIKDPAMICRIAPHVKDDWQLSIIGAEASIGSISEDVDRSINPAPYTSYWRPIIREHSAKGNEFFLNEKQLAKTDWRINAYPHYDYEFGMSTLGSSMASWCGYNISNPLDYGNRMEYTTIESFLLTLPIIHNHFASNAYSPEGKLWKDYDFILTSEATKEYELAQELERIANNPTEWNERTQAARDLIYRFNDINVIGQKFLDDILRLGKKVNKVDSMNIITKYFPDAQARRDRGEILVTSTGSFLNQKPMILVDGKQTEAKQELKTHKLF